MFDIKSYLEQKQVQYWEGGKNVSRGWININCLFCNDPSNHLGINLEEQYCSCWQCGQAGPLNLIVQRLENDCSLAQANTIMSKFPIILEEYEEEEVNKPVGSILPSEAMPFLHNIHQEYLEGRGFIPSELIRDYKLHSCYTLGKWKFRIIAPIFLGGEIVSFQALDVTGKAKLKYKLCPNDKAVIPARHLLYNIDSVQSRVIIVEGITDVWRIGPGSVATFGIEFSREQIDLLRNRNLKSALVVFDGEEKAIQKAYKLAGNLFFIPDVEVIELEDGKDPDSLDEEEIKELKGGN